MLVEKRGSFADRSLELHSRMDNCAELLDRVEQTLIEEEKVLTELEDIGIDDDGFKSETWEPRVDIDPARSNLLDFLPWKSVSRVNGLGRPVMIGEGYFFRMLRIELL